MEQNDNDKLLKIFNQIEEIAQKLQRHYFGNERFFDHINGAEQMDNTSGWTYETYYVITGYFKGDDAKRELKSLHDAFFGLAYLMECHGAGQTGSARGICHNIQYTWALSRNAAYLVKDLAREMNIHF